jgi:hypothetical protein
MFLQSVWSCGHAGVVKVEMGSKLVGIRVDLMLESIQNTEMRDRLARVIVRIIH